jgi:hypothetical protein
MKDVKLIGHIALLILLAFLTIMMLNITLEYFPFSTKVGFLRIKQWMFLKHPGLPSKFWLTCFYIHVMTSVIVLLAGFTQFSKKLYKNKIHRNLGKLYILVVVFLSGPTGLVMGYYANGGISSQLSFMLLSVLWIVITFWAFKMAVERKFKKHENLMIISYALTLSALTLRAWKYLFTAVIDLEIPPMDLYRIIAWLGWVPNLMVALLIIKTKQIKSFRNDFINGNF